MVIILMYPFVSFSENLSPRSIKKSGNELLLQDIISPWLSADINRHKVKPFTFIRNKPVQKRELYNYLAKAPQWCLCYDLEGNLVGIRRYLKHERWEIGNEYFKLYRNNHRNLYQITMKIYLDIVDNLKHQLKEIHINAKGKPVIIIPETATDSFYEHKEVSKIFFKCKGFSFYVLTSGPDNTKQVLINAVNYLLNVVFHDVPDNLGIQNISLAEKKNSIMITYGDQGGIYEISSCVNKQKEGIFFLRIVNEDNKDVVPREFMFKNTNEICGWSSNPNELFLYNRAFIVTAVNGPLLKKSKDTFILLCFKNKSSKKVEVISKEKLIFVPFER